MRGGGSKGGGGDDIGLISGRNGKTVECGRDN